MLSRPFFHSFQERALAEGGVRCEACQRMHNASFIVTLTGPKYDSDSLWKGTMSPLDFLSLEELEDSKSVDNVNELNTKTPTEDYRIGSHCHKRAQLYHRLVHFKATLIMQIQVCYLVHSYTPIFFFLLAYV